MYTSAPLRIAALILTMPLLSAGILAQDSAQPAPAGNDDHPVTVAKAGAPAEKPEDTAKRSWQILTEGSQDSKLVDTRTQALNALSSLGSNSRANALIADAMKDPNLDVRTAAVLAAGKSKSRALVPPVKKLLDDAEPQVVFVAAITLWTEFKDRSGEDVLAAIAAGDRKANPKLINGAKHDMSRTLHNPSALAKIGLETGAGMVLGPFGFSIAAVEYMRKNGADTARIQAMDLLAEQKTESVHEQMKSALEDKDPGVRAAAVKALGRFHRSRDAATIAPLLDDAKLPVRLAAAAAYIDCSRGAAKAKVPVQN